MVNRLVISVIVLICISVIPANAIVITNQSSTGLYVSKSQMIGIQLSQGCQIMEKNHIKSNCITYDRIKFLDNTNPLWSGLWVNDTWYHRLAPHVKNHEMMNLNTFVVMVDPNPDFTTRAKMIVIQSDNFTWINPDDGVGNNHTRIEHVNRMITDCSQATVAPAISLIKDTLLYLENGCTHTNYNDKILIKTGNQPFSFVNPYSTLHQDTYLKSILHNHLSYNGNHTSGGIGPSNCITHYCTPVKNPYANW